MERGGRGKRRTFSAEYKAEAQGHSLHLLRLGHRPLAALFDPFGEPTERLTPLLGRNIWIGQTVVGQLFDADNVRLVPPVIGGRLSFAASPHIPLVPITPDVICFFQHSLCFGVQWRLHLASLRLWLLRGRIQLGPSARPGVEASFRHPPTRANAA